MCLCILKLKIYNCDFIFPVANTHMNCRIWLDSTLFGLGLSGFQFQMKYNETITYTNRTLLAMFFGTLNLFLVLQRKHLWIAITRHPLSKYIKTHYSQSEMSEKERGKERERTKKGRRTDAKIAKKKREENEERKGERCRAYFCLVNESDL